MTIYLPWLVTGLGLVLMLAARSNAVARDVGRIMFACGLLATLLGGHALSLH